MKTRAKVLSAILATAFLSVGTGVLAAQAATTPITGTLNCAAYNVYYSTSRKIAEEGGGVQFKLTNNAGSAYGYSGVYLGAHITKTDTYLAKKFTDLPRNPNSGYMVSQSYLQGTAFTLYGSMNASDGTCDNTFGGTLYY